MTRIRAILFDMDGVLINAKDWHFDALNMALAEYGYEITRDEHLTIYDGNPTLTKLHMLTDSKGLPETLHAEISALKQRFTQKIASERCRPDLQHTATLSRLKQDGYRMALCSNSVRKSVDLMMDLSGLAPFLDFTISNQDVRRAKPDPEMYVTAINRLGYLPEQCLVLEDNEKGIRAAQASGAYVMEIDTVADVNSRNIESHIGNIDGGEVETIERSRLMG